MSNGHINDNMTISSLDFFLQRIKDVIITRELAQTIADKTSRIIGHNVNIMNNEGIIIGSNDPTRIDCFHPGAYEVIKSGKTIEMTEDEANRMMSSKPLVKFNNGINLPIRLDDEIIGVVGIKGNPDEIRQFGQILRMAVETMIKQFNIEEQAKLDLKSKKKFILNLLTEGENIDEEYYVQRGRALGYDILLPRIAGIFRIKGIGLALADANLSKKNLSSDRLELDFSLQISNSFAQNSQDIISFIDQDHFVFLKFVENPKKIASSKDMVAETFLKIIEYIKDKYGYGTTAGIGTFRNGISGLRKSFIEAKEAIAVGEKLYDSISVYSYEKLEVEILLNKIPLQQREQFISKFKLDDNLIITLEKLLENSMNIVSTASDLFVHRNTIVYRIKKIEENTKLSIHDLNNILMLKLFTILRKY